jgi:hypothetical protein
MAKSLHRPPTGIHHRLHPGGADEAIASIVGWYTQPFARAKLVCKTVADHQDIHTLESGALISDGTLNGVGHCKIANGLQVKDILLLTDSTSSHRGSS